MARALQANYTVNPVLASTRMDHLPKAVKEVRTLQVNHKVHPALYKPKANLLCQVLKVTPTKAAMLASAIHN